MAFKYTIDESYSNESWDIWTVLAGIATVAILSWNAWSKWKEKRKKSGNPPSADESADEFSKIVSRNNMIRVLDSVKKLDNTKFDEFIGTTKFQATPEIIKAEIELFQGLYKEFDNIDKLRNDLLKLKPEDVAQGKGQFNSLEAKIVKMYYLNIIGDSLGEEYEMYYWVPKAYTKQVKLLGDWNKPQPKDTLKENGWNKGNIDLIKQHILLFEYDRKDFWKVYQSSNDEFYKKTQEFLKRMLPYVDWFDGDPNNKADVEEELEGIENDEGAVSYAFGQDIMMTCEKPFDPAIVNSIEGAPIRYAMGLFKKINETKK